MGYVCMYVYFGIVCLVWDDEKTAVWYGVGKDGDEKRESARNF